MSVTLRVTLASVLTPIVPVLETSKEESTFVETNLFVQSASLNKWKLNAGYEVPELSKDRLESVKSNSTVSFL